MPDSIDTEFFTPATLAPYLKLKSERTLARWAAAGKGPARTRVGRRVLYRKVAVYQWLASREEITS